MRMGKQPRKDGRICGLAVRLWMIIALIGSWLLFVLLFIFGILAIVGTLGNAHEEVIRFMNCDKPNSAVSCSRVYGYRAEGVVLVILSFFALGWAVVLTITLLISTFRRRSGPMTQGGLTFSSAPVHTAHFATSEA